MKADFCVPSANDERIRKHELHGGGLLDIGLYPIQFACMVYGDLPEHIVAVGNKTQTGELEHDRRRNMQPNFNSSDIFETMEIYMKCRFTINPRFLISLKI